MDIDPRLRLRHVRAFLTVARGGSLTAAADAMRVTQPAISKTLRELEDILGLTLFDRSGRQLRLTPEGRAFQGPAGQAWAQLGRAQAMARGAQRGSRLVVGVLPTAATELLPRAALAFARAEPRCLLRVVTGPNWFLISQLRDGAIDLMVGRMAAPEAMAGLTFEQLARDEVALVARPGHPLAGAGAIGAEVADWPLILPPPGALIHGPALDWLTATGIGPVRPLFETVSLAFARRVVADSDALWLISRGVVADELAEGRLIALTLTGLMQTGPIGISTRADEPPGPEFAALRAALHAVAAARGT